MSRLAREALDLALRAERTEAASMGLSEVESPLADSSAELRGLSVLLEAPGILDRRDLKDRDDSFVSERLKEG